jgi:CCR4-NOT transcription complex subunit 3
MNSESAGIFDIGLAESRVDLRFCRWCAARELKRQSWRYHKQYLTWFQRLSQPQAITDEYEQGMYVYFDWENGWATRKKSDFRFE